MRCELISTHASANCNSTNYLLLKLIFNMRYYVTCSWPVGYRRIIIPKKALQSTPRVINIAYVIGLDGIQWNMKHSCKCCRSQRVLTSRLWQNVQRECFIFCGITRKKNPLCELIITRTYSKSSWYWFSFEREMTTKPSVFGQPPIKKWYLTAIQ